MIGMACRVRRCLGYCAHGSVGLVLSFSMGGEIG
jgi:hypothetical protein